MSNDMALFNPNQMPAFAKNAAPNALALALGGGSGSGGKRISIKGGVFRLIAGGKEIAAIEERYLDVVIVAAQPKVGRMYYAGKWDPTAKATAPACWSPDGDKPDEAVKQPQASACMSCPQNVAGSGQGNSKACRFERLAVVLANDIDGDVLQLALPSTSIFGDAENGNHPLHAYVKALAAQNINPDMVITRIKFDTSAEHPKLFFKPQGWLNEEQYKVVQEKGQSPEAIKAITLTVSQTDGVKSEASVAEQAEFAPEPAAKAKKTTKAAAPAASDEETAEPTVRKEKEAPQQVPTNDLAALANAWGDDD
jgi:hypothetical protein